MFPDVTLASRERKRPEEPEGLARVEVPPVAHAPDSPDPETPVDRALSTRSDFMAHDELLAEARDFLDAHQGDRQVNRVLHGFPSPRFWQPETVSLPAVMEQRKAWNEAAQAPFDLYVGVPYCVRTDPDRCGYCLFPVEVFQAGHAA